MVGCPVSRSSPVGGDVLGGSRPDVHPTQGGQAGGPPVARQGGAETRHEGPLQRRAGKTGREG